MKNAPLTKYWLTFNATNSHALGIGVTAYSLEDAIRLVSEKLFKSEPLPAFEHRTVIRLEELEHNHVLPNIGLIMFRGIWFPNFPPESR